jgi:hypothetical protein
MGLFDGSTLGERQMIAWDVGWQKTGTLIGISGFILINVGLVMLMVGWTRRKQGLWIAGLIVMLAPLVVMLLCAAMAFLGHLIS